MQLGSRTPVFDAVASNIAVRDFRDEQVQDEHLYRILEAARQCQSGKNLQPWYFVVIRERQVLDAIAEFMKDDIDELIVKRAPMAVAIVSDPSSEFHVVDAGRAAQNMTLVAWELGVGSVFISGLEPPNRQACRDMIKKFLKVPESLNLIDLIVFGYQKKAPTVKKKKRKKLEEITFQEEFGRKLVLEIKS